ncbi:hypothetical protein K435DRAFT_846265 [Dendrothele bispora CBS 962.96]|uniref:Fucose-specific lectin n=1 Tax=Dendrothele bispora (strain CBS 962.96) TaxID=1314807 RepID=A0A4V4HAY0_DENBC|nr:hypothetical protein K435DRAFT_846265 [Dendrothele bispora CBS 962.96]
MQLLKLIATAVALIAGVEAAANFFPVDAVGNIAAVRDDLGKGATHIYYQARNGSIVRLCTSTSFIQDGPQNCGSTEVVPANEVMYGTPITAATLWTSSGGFDGNHVYYYSPDGILSEYINNIQAPAHGPSCTQCVTNQRFGVVNGSVALYSFADTKTPGMQLRVGFESVGSPGTITEATFNSNTKKWSLSVLPN